MIDGVLVVSAFMEVTTPAVTKPIHVSKATERYGCVVSCTYVQHTKLTSGRTIFRCRKTAGATTVSWTQMVMQQSKS